jgi:hypothetical protein
MDKITLLKKLDAMLDEAARAQLYGSIEIQFANGQPTILRKNSTTKLDGGNTRYEPQFESRKR